MTWAIRLRVVPGTDTGQSVGYIIIYLNNSSSLDYSMVSTSFPHMLLHLIFITTPQGGFLFVEDQVNEFFSSSLSDREPQKNISEMGLMKGRTSGKFFFPGWIGVGKSGVDETNTDTMVVV